MRPKTEWVIDSEPMRARGIIVLVKSNKLVKKISRLDILRLLKLDFNPFLWTKHYKYDEHFSLLVGYKETVVLRRWERSKQKFGFIKRVDKG